MWNPWNTGRINANPCLMSVPAITQNQTWNLKAEIQKCGLAVRVLPKKNKRDPYIMTMEIWFLFYFFQLNDESKAGIHHE